MSDERYKVSIGPVTFVLLFFLPWLLGLYEIFRAVIDRVF